MASKKTGKSGKSAGVSRGLSAGASKGAPMLAKSEPIAKRSAPIAKKVPAPTKPIPATRKPASVAKKRLAAAAPPLTKPALATKPTKPTKPTKSTASVVEKVTAIASKVSTIAKKVVGAGKGPAKKAGASKRGVAADASASGPGEQSSVVRVDVGDAAPAFVLQDETGSVVSSESLRGSPYVLYFYPKDDTPGCTLEACGFRDSLPRFSAKGVRVLGVSPDSPEVHARFRKKYGLTFSLLSDPEKTLAKAYGVWVNKQNYGREYMGVERSTFAIDRRGVVRQVWRGVRVPGHVDAVLHAV